MVHKKNTPTETMSIMAFKKKKQSRILSTFSIAQHFLDFSHMVKISKTNHHYKVARTPIIKHNKRNFALVVFDLSVAVLNLNSVMYDDLEYMSKPS